MEVRTCIKCGQLFHNFPDSPVCQRCWLELDKEIHEGSDDPPFMFPCKNCGTLIYSGKLCENCKLRTISFLHDFSDESEASETDSDTSWKNKRKKGEMFTAKQNAKKRK